LHKKGGNVEKLKNQSGFTLIELVMVIVILGILSAIAIPKFADLTTQAKISAGKGGLGAIRSSLAIEYAKSATSGTASFPSAITTSLFADGLIPKNALNNSTSVGVVTVAPAGTATSTDGWWYISASGRAGAYSDGTQDTSTW
jgi:MSHA pilin protein MshA